MWHFWMEQDIQCEQNTGQVLFYTLGIDCIVKSGVFVTD